MAVSGCDCTGEVPGCTLDTDCEGAERCVDGTCRVPMDSGPMDAGQTDAGQADAGPPMGCGATERACGQACCAAGDVCGSNVACCALEDLCGSTCCGAGEVCEGAICRLDCGAEARCTDEGGAAVCCASGEVCASGRCFVADTPCADFIDCAAGEYCEPTLGRCLPQPAGEECVERPSGGAVQPDLLWHWDGVGAAEPTFNQVMMAPMVANLNDDNGDGSVDASDIPDVVFNTFAGSNYSRDGVLRAVSGEDGSSIFDVTNPAHHVIGGAQVAIGNIDGDPEPEIVTCGASATGIGQLIAFNHDGSLLWVTTDPDAACGQAAPAIADLDGDGTPEVFVSYTVVDGATGATEWHRDCIGTGGWATGAHSPCDYTTAADLDADGRLEVVGGNIAYRHDGSVYFDRTADFRDGYPAIGDLDLDGTPEIVVVYSAFTPAPYDGDNELRALNFDGTDLWGPIDLNVGMATGPDDGGGGPPTIANFDDDPEPEIAAAGAYSYAVFEPDGSMRWASPSDDASSRKTGSSVFDFDGDGISEVVYNDHFWLRVYDGPDGDVRFCLCNRSATLWEYPVIVDVNRDGAAEIVVASNDYAGPATCGMSRGAGQCEADRIAAGDNLTTHGVRVFASPTRDWVGTRPIWNQHTYHITNVSESGQIPTRERPSWSVPGLNNFRLNVQPGATNLPDLAPIDLAVDRTQCTRELILNFQIENQGWSAAPAGAVVGVYVQEESGFVLLTTVTTTRALLPGETEAFTAALDLDGRDAFEVVRFRVVANDSGEPLVECRVENNQAETEGSCDVIF